MSTYRVGFIMDQIAGHVTNYRNLRSASANVPDMIATWHEIDYYKANGRIEQLHERALPFVSKYVTGITRGALEVHRALRDYRQYDALFTNASVGVFFSHTFHRLPTLIDFDSTPLQIDRMEVYGSANDSKPVAYLKWRLSRSMLHSGTLLQAWSRWARQSAIDEYGVAPEKIVVNPPGVNLSFWRPGPSPKTTARPFRILFVGGDFRRKGGQQLLTWYRDQTPAACELHLVTREPVEPRPGIFVYDSIQPNSEELLHLYQESDLFVLPSLGECFGIATVEAMAAGLPVIASDVGGTGDIVDDGQNGFIVPGGDISKLSSSIATAMENQTLRRTMAARSRSIAEERFDLHRNARRTFDLLRSMAQQSEERQRLMVSGMQGPQL